MHQVPCEPLGSLLGRLACYPFAERWLLCFCFKHQVVSFLGLTLSIRPEKANHARQVWVYVKPPAPSPECLVPHRPRHLPPPPSAGHPHSRGLYLSAAGSRRRCCPAPGSASGPHCWAWVSRILFQGAWPAHSPWQGLSAGAETVETRTSGGKRRRVRHRRAESHPTRLRSSGDRPE